VSCKLAYKWKCGFCSLRRDEHREVIKCEGFDPDESDCLMPIQIRFIERKDRKCLKENTC